MLLICGILTGKENVLWEHFLDKETYVTIWKKNNLISQIVNKVSPFKLLIDRLEDNCLQCRNLDIIDPV